MKKIVLILLFALISPAWAGNDFKGTTAAGFLKLGVGARAAALGEAYSAFADDASAIYWNPAALTRIEKNSLTFMHAPYLDKSFFDFAAYGRTLENVGSVGVSLQYFSYGSFNAIDDRGFAAPDVSANDLALAIAYAREIYGYSLGMSAKFIRSTIIDSAQTGAVDIGILSPSISKRVRLALTATNLGGKLKFEEESAPLPRTVRFGAKISVSNPILVGLDVGFPQDNSPFAAFGAEYGFKPTENAGLALRMGYNTQTLGDVNGFTGVSFGVGFALRKFAFDYAIVPVGALGSAHRLSLTVRY